MPPAQNTRLFQVQQYLLCANCSAHRPSPPPCHPSAPPPSTTAGCTSSSAQGLVLPRRVGLLLTCTACCDSSSDIDMNNAVWKKCNSRFAVNCRERHEVAAKWFNINGAMGGSSSKAGGTITRAARAMPRAGVPGRNHPPASSHLPGDEDLLTKFTPKKGETPMVTYFDSDWRARNAMFV